MESRKRTRLCIRGALCWLLLVQNMPLALASEANRQYEEGQRFLITALAVFLISTSLLMIRLLRERNMRRVAAESCQRAEWVLSLQQEHYRKVLFRQKQLRIYRHDMVNHMMVINNLLELGQHQRLKQYLQEIEDPVAVGDEVLTTGNLMVDALLTEKRLQARKENVWLEDSVLLDVAAVPSFAFFDLFINVGLTHAIEVASQILGPKEDRWVDLELSQKQGGLLGKLRYAAQNPENTADRQALQPLLRVVEKSGGVWNLTREQDAVSLQFSLPAVRSATGWQYEWQASARPQITMAGQIGVDGNGEGDTL